MRSYAQIGLTPQGLLSRPTLHADHRQATHPPVAPKAGPQPLSFVNDPYRPIMSEEWRQFLLTVWQALGIDPDRIPGRVGLILDVPPVSPPEPGRP